MRPQPLSGRSGSVSDDWRAWLPEAHDSVFRWAVGELDACYTMLSVTLNEAIALRQDADLCRAREEAGFCSELVERFSTPLARTLRVLESHARHYGTLPNAVPLDPENFRCARSQRVAWMQSLLCRVLFSARSQLFHKLHSLQELVEELADDFRAAALDIAEGTSTDPALVWESLDDLHYDLNTCLREALVLLKSFLRVLPASEVEAFRETLEAAARSVPEEPKLQRPVGRDGRAAAMGRK